MWYSNLRDVRLQVIPLASLDYDDCGVELAIECFGYLSCNKVVE